MKITSRHFLLALTLMVYGVTAQPRFSTASPTQASTSPVGLIVFFVFLVIGILVGYYMYKSLMDKDKQLPEHERCMTGPMQILFWLLCICCGLICGLVFYLIASNEIDTRLRRINMQQAGANVPVQVVDKA